MLKLRDIIDIVKRRTNGRMLRDNMEIVYTKYTPEHAEITFILGYDPEPAEATKLAVTYQHLFGDVTDLYTVHFLTKTNNFKKDMETHSIWSKSKGFFL